MPRPSRVHVPNGVWHVTHRATDSEVFFREPADFRAFLDLLGDTARWAEWILHDYCLMTNHLHLVVRTPLPTLPNGMRRLMGTYMEKFNLRNVRQGALVQGRYKARRLDPSIADVWGPGPDTSYLDGYLPAFCETKSATAAICSSE